MNKFLVNKILTQLGTKIKKNVQYIQIFVSFKKKTIGKFSEDCQSCEYFFCLFQNQKIVYHEPNLYFQKKFGTLLSELCSQAIR